MIYIALISFIVLLIVSFALHNKFIGIISGFGLSITGIYIAINGISGLNTFLVQTIALIYIALGLYVILIGNLEQAMEALGG